MSRGTRSLLVAGGLVAAAVAALLFWPKKSGAAKKPAGAQALESPKQPRGFAAAERVVEGVGTVLNEVGSAFQLFRAGERASSEPSSPAPDQRSDWWA